MEVVPADGGNSIDTPKEDKPVKMNGDMNGSAEGMEVDEESADGVDGASDESVYGSSRAPDGDDPNSHMGSEVDGKSNSHFETESEGKGNGESDGEGLTRSQFGSEYGAKSEGQTEGADMDGLGDGDGESVNSEEEEALLHSENDEEGHTKGQENKESAQNLEEMDAESEEEGDINAENDEVNNDGEEDDSDKGENKTNADEEHDDKDNEKTPEAIQNGNSDQLTPNKKKRSPTGEVTLTPRRSSRTVQKPVRFGQEPLGSDEELDSDGIEEVAPSDPLADPLIDKENRRFPRMIGNTTIVINDAKRLADIAAQRSPTTQPKKEPTLVIIDTNSILKGKGALPMQTQGGVTITQQPAPTKHYQPLPTPPKPKPPPILPTLTDDMYVVEAPSFIVPYVYEKPPVKKFKKFLKKMLKEVKKNEERKKKGLAEATNEEKVVEDKEDSASVKDDIEVSKEDKKDEGDVKSDEADEKMEVDEEKEEVEKSPAKDEPMNLETKEKATEDSKAKDEEKKSNDKKDAKSEESEDSGEEEAEEEEEKKKTAPTSYFDNPLGKFFMQIGMNLVQEFVQTDLLKQQKKKQKMGKGTEETQAAIVSLKKNLLISKETNEPYAMEQIKCEFCSFKTESKLIMAHHLETPHMRNYVYRCNFCPLEVRGPHDILFHMEAEHVVRGRLERAPAFHQCPQCPFEDNQKGKLTRHLLTCVKKFRPEKNLEPPPDWEPPAKIPRLPRKPSSMPMGNSNSLYPQGMGKNLPPHLLPKMAGGVASSGSPIVRPQRGRPPYPQLPVHQAQKMLNARTPLPPQLTRGNMLYRPGTQNSSPPVILPSYPISNPLYQVMGAAGGPPSLPALQRLGSPSVSQQKNQATVKLLNQPSISITPLPRQSTNNPQAGVPPPRAGAPGSNSKSALVICEICDGYIKDLEQLRNHMQWIHKVKIHPKMIYNRPPLNCQKCQFRFFTDQGLERHLLGSHGLVTSSMQDQANRGKDGGRCPLCGKVYQWKLLNHVAREHNMTLKPAHLSYKCTVCTATFGMYKQFESHVYSAHSVVAKRVMDKKNGQAPSTSRTDTASLLKPLKINDEITIIPQPAKKQTSANQRPVPSNFRATPKVRGPDSVQVIDLEDSPHKGGENGAESLTAVKERLRRRQSLEIRQVESEEGDATESDGEAEGEGDGDNEMETETPMDRTQEGEEDGEESEG